MFRNILAIFVSVGFSTHGYASATNMSCQSTTQLEANLSEIGDALEQVEDKKCNDLKIDKNTYSILCESLYEQKPAVSQSLKKKGIKYAYQEFLWAISCANEDEDVQSATLKIQAMWNKHKEHFNCPNSIMSIASDKSIVKFAIDTKRDSFLADIRRYKLDLNFKDKNDNDKTVFDFIKEQEQNLVKKGEHEKAEYFGKLYVTLKTIAEPQAK